MGGRGGGGGLTLRGDAEGGEALKSGRGGDAGGGNKEEDGRCSARRLVEAAAFASDLRAEAFEAGAVFLAVATRAEWRVIGMTKSTRFKSKDSKGLSIVISFCVFPYWIMRVMR